MKDLYTNLGICLGMTIGFLWGMLIWWQMGWGIFGFVIGMTVGIGISVVTILYGINLAERSMRSRRMNALLRRKEIPKQKVYDKKNP